MKNIRTLLKNAILNGEKTDILIESNRIKKIEKHINEMEYIITDADRLIYADGLTAIPAFCDMHFHLRNPGFDYKQTYEEASRASVKGGFCAVIAMANTLPPCDNKDVIEKVELESSRYPLMVKQIATVSKGLQGKELVNFEDLLESTRIFSDDGKNIDSEELMRLALIKSKELDFIILDHNEPETEMVVRNLKLVEETGGNLHFCHISKKASMEAIIEGKKKGLNITCEIAPHHIFSSNLKYRVNPPIATEKDRLFLIECIKNGHVDMIGTDHAPHSDEDKANGAPGIINIENAFSMVWKVFNENDISLETLTRLMSVNTGKVLGLDLEIKEGNVANMILFKDTESTIRTDKFVTRSKNTPYDGWKVRGVVEKTFIKGVCCYDNERA